MLPLYIIDDLRKRERERKESSQRPQPQLELPLPPAAPPIHRESGEENRGFVIIPLWGEDSGEG